METHSIDRNLILYTDINLTMWIFYIAFKYLKKDKQNMSRQQNIVYLYLQITGAT